MFRLRKPTPEWIARFLREQAEAPFSYADVGGTRGRTPRGFVETHHRLRLGCGRETFEAACRALGEWKMFGRDWLEVHPEQGPLRTGQTVAVAAGFLGLWSHNACRVVEMIDEAGPVRRFGFTYGTLGEHVECGEERFLVEWDRADDAVWYDVFSFSRPHHWVTWLGYPVVRLLQKRFVRESGMAMQRAVHSTGEVCRT